MDMLGPSVFDFFKGKPSFHPQTVRFKKFAKQLFTSVACGFKQTSRTSILLTSSSPSRPLPGLHRSIDKIEKENFGLTLKMYFPQGALRKAGTGFSEVVPKENKELKVEKVQMQEELHRHRKTASSTEKEINQYHQQIAQLQRQPRSGASNENFNHLQDALHEREPELKSLYQKLDKDDA